MDRKLLFKSNIVGNTALRTNRVAKANSDRNLKRKELFSRGRAISNSPEENKAMSPKPSKKYSKKSEEMAKKEEAHRVRFMAYMEEKKRRLAKEKENKKPPFICASSGQSKHKVVNKPFEFIAPQAPVRKTAANSKTSSTVSNRLDSTTKGKNKPVKSRSKNTVPRVEAPDDSKRHVLRPRNLKIIENKTKTVNNWNCFKNNVQNETPMTKEGVFVFDVEGPTLTSTARKDSSHNSNNLITDFESVFSPIDGIAPLEVSICGENQMEVKENLPESSSAVIASEVQKLINDEKTPPKQDNPEPGNFYLSPFVTTSRGKGSAKKERSNRDSIYKLELNQSLEEPLDVRRRREAVKYFRKILDDERNRLNSLCANWEAYKQDNASRYEEHCTDMINVAVGQTKLLIYGKFKQFEKLIDDCEKCANANKRVRQLMTCQEDITPEDLDGYWNIVKLQAENVDRRFDNLLLWKNNEWQDPDEKTKARKTVLAKPMKAKKPKQKLNPNQEVKSLIMKAHREYLKNKHKNTKADQDIIFMTRCSNVVQENIVTPVKRTSLRRSQTPYRPSIAITQARTPTVKIMTPAQRRLSIFRNSGSGTRYSRRLSETPKSTSERKSILKSESKSTRKKSVLFSEQILYKSPESRSSSQSNLIQSDENEENARVMHLRNRKVLMRDDIDDFI